MAVLKHTFVLKITSYVLVIVAQIKRHLAVSAYNMHNVGVVIMLPDFFFLSNLSRVFSIDSDHASIAIQTDNELAQPEP